MLELFHTAASTCSQKVRLALAFKSLAWTSREVDLAKGEHLTPDYLKMNPNGVVPTLLDRGTPIVDSSVINEYLEDAYPQKPLRPREPTDIARMRAWRQFIDEVPTPAIRVPSFNRLFVQMWGRFSEDAFEAYAEQLPLRRDFYLKMGRNGFDEAEVASAHRRLRTTLERAEASLAEGPWLIGQDYSLADVSLTPILVRLEDLGLAHLWSDLPAVADWYRRITTQDNFDKAYTPGSRAFGQYLAGQVAAPGR